MDSGSVPGMTRREMGVGSGYDRKKYAYKIPLNPPLQKRGKVCGLDTVLHHFTHFDSLHISYLITALLTEAIIVRCFVESKPAREE
jgi:hypothetical protein